MYGDWGGLVNCVSEEFLMFSDEVDLGDVDSCVICACDLLCVGWWGGDGGEIGEGGLIVIGVFIDFGVVSLLSCLVVVLVLGGSVGCCKGRYWSSSLDDGDIGLNFTKNIII